MTRLGLCCISLALKEQGYSFSTLTFKRFSALPRDEALQILGDRIVNNLVVTNECIKLCAANDWCYRLSSDLFPLITYQPAEVDLTDLPQYDEVLQAMDDIHNTIKLTNVRVSTHPSQFQVLASTNQDAVSKTIDELNFYSSFMDFIGCYADHRCPINLHINNNDGTRHEIANRFLSNYNKLDPNCRARITIENDDKPKAWTVQELIEVFHPITNIPICFDYLHNKCNPSIDNDYSEKTCVKLCYYTWQGHRPLFHYSESRPGNNPRAHCDIPTEPFDTYGLDFDVDMEVKLKDYAIAQYQEGVMQNV